MNKGLIVPKWMLISCSKVPQIPPNFICPNYLTKPKSSEFWWKKDSLGVRSPCMRPYLTLSEKEDCTFWYCFAIIVGKVQFFWKLPSHDKRIIFFSFFLACHSIVHSFNFFQSIIHIFFLKVKCRINSKSLLKWDIF